MLVSELINKLQAMDQTSEVAADIWDFEDIRSASEDHEKLTDAHCKIVIDYLQRNLDSEYGINNERVIRVVDNLISEGQIVLIQDESDYFVIADYIWHEMKSDKDLSQDDAITKAAEHFRVDRSRLKNYIDNN